MKGYYDNEGYYRKLIELQEKLRRSEEERMKLEEKFNKMIQHKRKEEQLELQRLKRQYNKFLEEEKFRSERNDQIIRALDRIEYKAAMLTAKTDRLRILRGQYENCIKRSLTWNYNNNNNNVKPIVQQSTRDISYTDGQQSRPTSLNIGSQNPFPSKFIYPSTSNDSVSNNTAQYYPKFDQTYDQNMNKPTSTTYINKQNTPINFGTSNFDNNNYGSKITSRYTPNVVQENSGIIRGHLPTGNPLNKFSENGFPQFDARDITHENANTYYPSFYNQKNDGTYPTYGTEKVQSRPENNIPQRDTWPNSNDSWNSREVESLSQNLPRKVDFISSLSTISNNPRQLSQEIEKSKHEEFNIDNIKPSGQEDDTKIKPKDKIKPTTYIVDDEHNDAEDVRILKNAYDGYYVDDEREQIFEESKQKNEPEKSSKPANLPPSNLATPNSLQANQTSKIQSNTYQEKNHQVDQQHTNNDVAHKTPTEATENIMRVNGNAAISDSVNRAPSIDKLSDNSLNNANPSEEYTVVNPVENTSYEDQQISETKIDQINANNYESENTNYDDQQIVNQQVDFEQTQATVYDQDDYETNYDQETVNQTKVDEYANYNESQNNGDVVVKPDEIQMQEGYVDYSQSENYEPGLNSDTAQLQEGYENYEPGVNSDTIQSQEGYEPGVNINQIPEVYGKYDEPQGGIDQDSTLQYEGYDDTQQQFDPNNPADYDNTQQQFDPKNPADYDNTQQQFDPNNVEGYDSTQQQFDPNNPEGYNNTQQQFDPNNPESYDNTQQQYDPNNPEGYDTSQAQIDPNDPQGYENDQGQYDPNNVVYDETNQIGNVESSQMYSEDSVVGDGTSAVQYTDDNQMYYAENQEYSQGGQEYQQGVEGYDAQANGEYENVAQDGVYQQDDSEYPIGNMPQDGVYQDQAYQDTMYSEGGQLNYTAESNNIQEQENYGMNDSNQSEMNLQNEVPVEKLTSNLTTLLDSDTSEQQSSEQQQVPSVRDESDFDFSESAAN